MLVQEGTIILEILINIVFIVQTKTTRNHGIGPDNPSVLDLRWETSITSDLGIDFSFLQNKISGTIELYNTKSNDVLVSNSPLKSI